MSTKEKESSKIIVPRHLKGKTIWTVAPKFKQEVAGRFIIDKCTPEELEYLKSKGKI
jgi:hypothetical protein